MRQVILAAAFVLSMAGTAHADTFVWQDPKGDFSISFPDSWQVQTPDKGNTIVRVAGPLGEDRATCKVEMSPDGRVKIYPREVSEVAVAERLDLEFWRTQAAEHANVKIIDYYAPSSLGDQGDATAIRIAFTEDDGQDKNAKMYGVMLGGIYGGNLYVASCASRYDMYPRYVDLFGSILDSIMLKRKYHPFATGYYRNFLMDPKLILPRSKPGTIKDGSPAWRNLFSLHEYHYNR